MTALGRLAAWTGPLLAAGIAARVFRGEADAPWLVILALVAPFAALVRSRESLPATVTSAVIALLGLPLVLSANLALLADVLRPRGIPREGAVLLGLFLLLLPLVAGRSVGRVAAGSAVLGIGGLLLPLVVVSQTTGAAPWTAWSRVASRPALVFSDRGVAVGSGRAVAAPVTLRFTESHRITAVAATTVRVFEDDGGRLTVHERRLASGEGLLLRLGDRLSVDEISHLRFEGGKRVPGAVASGAVWADSPERSTPRAAFGMAGGLVTMLGGALVLVGPAVAAGRARTASAIAAPALTALFVLGAASWGIYATYVAPELLVGATLLTPLAELPLIVGSRHAAALGAAVAMGLVVLLVAMGAALAGRVAEVLGSPAGRGAGWLSIVVWIGLATAAAVASVSPVDPWRIQLTGLGLLATTWAAPRLATGDDRAAAAGGIVGGLAFGVVALVASGAELWTAVRPTPALVAAPLAWAVAWLVARRPVAAPPRR